ncbi:MAG: hypothetical protein WBC22_19540 [Sedimentisphaerales bacterium]
MDPNSVNFLTLSNDSAINFFSALLGAIVGGVATYIATMHGVKSAHKMDLQKEQQSLETSLQSFYRSALVEIDTLWSIYSNAIGEDIEKLTEGEPFLKFYPITQDYFSTYKSNTSLIGRIPDNDIRNLFVKSYAVFQSFSETFNLNNRLVSDHQEWSWLAAQTNNEIHKLRAQATHEILVDFVKAIKLAHNTIKIDVCSLMGLLKKKVES